MTVPVSDRFMPPVRYNKTTFEIGDQLEKTKYVNYLQSEFMIQIEKSNKTYSMFNINDSGKIQRGDFLIYPNTKTFRFKQSLLWLTKINGISQSIVVEKKIDKQTTRIYIVKYMFDESLYNDTIFEGELIFDKNKVNVFLISDILVLKHERQNKLKMTERYELINNILDPFSKLYIRIPKIESFELMVKPFLHASEKEKMFEDIIPQLRYNNIVNGIVYRENIGYKNIILFDKNRTIHSDTVIKTKSLTNPRDFKLTSNIMFVNMIVKKIDTDVYEVYLLKYPTDEIHATNMFKYGVAYIKGLSESKKMEDIFSCVENSHCIMRCKNTENGIVPCDLSNSTRCDNIKELVMLMTESKSY